MEFPWRVVDSGQSSPEALMAKDAFLLEQLEEDSPPILHLYEWKGSCLTYGYFTNPAHYLHLEVLESLGLRKARRPTGGGIIFHLTDFAFSLLLPAGHPHFSLNTLENYALVNHHVAKVVASFTQHTNRPGLFVQDPACTNHECHPFCMAKSTPYDLVIDGKKVGGAAQRRTRKGLLHQASLSLTLPPLDLLAQVLKEEQVLREMQKNSYCLLPDQASDQDLHAARKALKQLIISDLRLGSFKNGC